MKNIRAHKGMVLLVAGLIVGSVAATYLLIVRSSPDDASPLTHGEQKSEDKNSQLPQSTNEQLSDENSDAVDDPRPSEGEPIKQPTQTELVREKPIVYTGFGHNPAKPLPNGQATSTTCTTDSNVSCSLTFTNQETDEVVTFDEKTTDPEGVALWTWVGGKDLTSGTWAVVAVAGSKTSDEEVIYVQ